MEKLNEEGGYVDFGPSMDARMNSLKDIAWTH